jgi:putative SOS response-associated peptidase YedK
MCGRYGRWSPRERLEALLAGSPLIDELEEWRPSYNAAPGVPQPIIRATPDGGEATIQAVLGGLVPFWAKDLKSGPHPINAKAETAKDRPMFRKRLRERRCLIRRLFYEWKETPAGKSPRR